MNKDYKGSCLCGACTYKFSGEVNDYGYCHCIGCRKASGSAHSANAGVPASSFHLKDENNFLREYQSSPGTHRFFCSNCGSPLFSRIDESPDLVRIRLGTLDTSLNKKCARHTFVSEKAPWHDMADQIPKFNNKFQ